MVAAVEEVGVAVTHLVTIGPPVTVEEEEVVDTRVVRRTEVDRSMVVEVVVMAAADTVVVEVEAAGGKLAALPTMAITASCSSTYASTSDPSMASYAFPQDLKSKF